MNARGKPVEHALVTGASSGIGEAVALCLARRGAKSVSFCGRDAARLEAVAEAVRAAGAEAFPQVIDVTDRGAVRAWIEECDARAPLDLVYANAGISTGGREDDENAVRGVFGVNVGGVLNTVYPAIDVFKNDAPRAARRIAVTSSMTGYHGMPQCPAYSASKCAVKALGAALRGRLKRSGITVTTICPGFVRSRITDQNTCPMPFFWEAPKAAEKIVRGIEAGKGLVTFPWQMRFGMWLLSAMPEILSEKLFSAMPEKN